jgi:hypothetical protein
MVVIISGIFYIFPLLTSLKTNRRRHIVLLCDDDIHIHAYDDGRGEERGGKSTHVSLMQAGCEDTYMDGTPGARSASG